MSPARRPLLLPTRALALGIAAEWEWQEARAIRPFTMPLMRLASIATDEIPPTRHQVRARCPRRPPPSHFV